MGAAARRIERWQEVHAELIDIGVQRGAIDAREAAALRDAEDLQIWKPLAYVSMLDYLERTLGYAPRTAQERLRVARALRALPHLSDALATGTLHFSAVKELVRVATPATETVWRDSVRGMNLRQIEELVAGRRPGDLPTDPRDERARTHTVRFDDVSAAAFATLRHARQLLNEEHGRHLSDSEVVSALANAIVQPAAPADTDGRAKHQLAYVVCEVCDRMSQEAAGVRIPVDDATKAQVRCDAQHIGSLDADTPARATQDIPPATARFVWRRDQGRCQTPGCRSARCIEIHHVVPRERGGTHDPSNLTLRCDACHRAHHLGLITISGVAPDRLTTTRNTLGASTKTQHHRPGPEATPPSTNIATTRQEAIEVLTTSGFPHSVAVAAVDEACAHVGASSELAELVRDAFRRCPRRRGS
ncbi:MAG: HNH endonuclease [Kofleriaceae bacterium]